MDVVEVLQPMGPHSILDLQSRKYASCRTAAEQQSMVQGSAAAHAPHDTSAVRDRPSTGGALLPSSNLGPVDGPYQVETNKRNALLMQLSHLCGLRASHSVNL